jgi:predicted nuclease of predicted toxin-antitoxin system
MKLLLDTCMWGGTVADLEAAGHDVDHVGRWARDPGDGAILQTARESGRIVVTLDKGFGELAIVRRQAHSGIIRIVGGSVTTHAAKILSVLERYADDLRLGAIVTAEENRTRIRFGE